MAVNPSNSKSIHLFFIRFDNMKKKMKDGWLQNPANRNILRFYKSQPNPSKIFIVFIDEIVKKDQEINFIIK